MNLRQLRSFVTIADAGGLARAEGRLHLSPPAASRQIQALEAELGVPLFDRLGRRMQLTSEGEDLLRRSRRLLQDAEALGERAKALRKGKIGILRIGATPQTIEATLAPFMSAYQKRHPGVEIHLVEDGGVSLPSRIDNGDVHLGLIVSDQRFERFQNRTLYPAIGLALLPPSHRLGGSRTLEVAALAEQPLLLLNRSFASREWFDAACSVAHVRPPVLLESAAAHTIIALAAAGYGIAIIPSTAQVSRAGLRAVPLVQRGAPLGRWLTIAWDPQRFLAPYAEQFIEKLVAYCRRHYPGREYVKRAPSLPQLKSATLRTSR